MARTRTSDQTLCRHHAKLLVYACLLAFGFTRPAAADRRGQEPVPCATCQVLSVTADQVGDLPTALAGVRIVVRTSPRARGWQSAWAAFSRRGATTGLHGPGVPGEHDPLLDTPVPLVILEPA